MGFEGVKGKVIGYPEQFDVGVTEYDRHDPQPTGERGYHGPRHIGPGNHQQETKADQEDADSQGRVEGDGSYPEAWLPFESVTAGWAIVVQSEPTSMDWPIATAGASSPEGPADHG